MMFAVVAGFIAVGIILSFYGSQVVTEGLLKDEKSVLPGENLEIIAELDPEKNAVGVYVIQNMNFKEDMVSAKVYDPLDTQLVSETIPKDSFEGRFDITSKGNYKLIIENSGEEAYIIGVIGHVPEAGQFSIGLSGFYILIMGLIGIVGVGIYAVKNRKKGF